MSLFESTDKYIQEWLCRLGSLLRSLCLHQPELTNEAEIQSNSSAASKKDINKKKKRFNLVSSKQHYSRQCRKHTSIATLSITCFFVIGQPSYSTQSHK